MSIALKIKKLSVLSFRRVFEFNPYILIIPKIFLIKALVPIKHFYCLPYLFKYSNFKYEDTIPNLVSLFFTLKNEFFKYLKISLPFLFGLKFKNIYFNSLSLLPFNFLDVENKKKIILKIKYSFLFIIKYIYSFIRYFKITKF